MTTKEQMVQEIAAFLHTYLKAGYVQLDSFSQKIDQRIDRFEQLFIIRFLLHERTKQFVRNLPFLIRNVKTITTTERQTTVAEVRGAVDWMETIRTRVNQNYADKLTFVTNEHIRSYDTQENLVLKRLLTILYETLYNNEYVKRFFREQWSSEWDELKRNVRHTLYKNIYIQRVSHVPVSDRMIVNTTKHRNPLYREAAILLSQYERFMRGEFEQEELEQLLRETFILPKEEDTLFELYWVVQLIKQNTETSTLHLMYGTDHLVASWEKGAYHYYVYHDSTGPKELSFNILRTELKDSVDPYVQRIYDAFEQANKYGEAWFGREKSNIFRLGRPDIIVVIRHKESEKMVKLIIGEVKNTTSTNYAMTGLRELLDYIYLVKYNDDYAHGRIPVQGILCVGDVEWGGTSENDDHVKLVTPGERGRLVIKLL